MGVYKLSDFKKADNASHETEDPIAKEINGFAEYAQHMIGIPTSIEKYDTDGKKKFYTELIGYIHDLDDNAIKRFKIYYKKPIFLVKELPLETVSREYKELLKGLIEFKLSEKEKRID